MDKRLLHKLKARVQLPRAHAEANICNLPAQADGRPRQNAGMVAGQLSSTGYRHILGGIGLGTDSDVLHCSTALGF